ncbi:MAG TPA: protein tyrosine phosphatase family protein [Gammaproteobacteria bacterium]|nr:protein tyrosine phosphatase family protein [Gammaproteobacteria bacterium]
MRLALTFAATLLVGMVGGALLYAYAPQLIYTADHSPPVNFVAASARIDTAGQPSAAQLRGLRAKGYGLVVNLSPPDSAGSIAGEGRLVAGSGIDYVNIPVDYDAPRVAQFELFSRILQASQARRVLVHCQLNGRASVFTFLYRVVYEHAAPDSAYEKVTDAWVPNARWKRFAASVLGRHGIDYSLP